MSDCGCPICPLVRREKELIKNPTVEGYHKLYQDAMSAWINEGFDSDNQIMNLDFKVRRFEKALETIRKKCFDDSVWARYIDKVLKRPFIGGKDAQQG